MKLGRVPVFFIVLFFASQTRGQSPENFQVVVSAGWEVHPNPNTKDDVTYGLLVGYSASNFAFGFGVERISPSIITLDKLVAINPTTILDSIVNSINTIRSGAIIEYAVRLKSAPMSKLGSISDPFGDGSVQPLSHMILPRYKDGAGLLLRIEALMIDLPDSSSSLKERQPELEWSLLAGGWIAAKGFIIRLNGGVGNNRRLDRIFAETPIRLKVRPDFYTPYIPKKEFPIRGFAKLEIEFPLGGEQSIEGSSTLTKKPLNDWVFRFGAIWDLGKYWSKDKEE